jgi:hypothetical protein
MQNVTPAELCIRNSSLKVICPSLLLRQLQHFLNSRAAASAKQHPGRKLLSMRIASRQELGFILSVMSYYCLFT